MTQQSTPADLLAAVDVFVYSGIRGGGGRVRAGFCGRLALCVYIEAGPSTRF